MPKVALLNLKGEKIKDVKLDDSIWGITPNDQAIYESINLYMANKRQGSHAVKNRSEVSGGGRKPWRQKGTGRARQGSIRATQRRGGGIALGPKPRDYSIKMNRKERRLALLSALSYKAKEKKIVVVDNIDLENSKTKTMKDALTKLEIADKKVLIVMDELTENVILSSRNLQNILLMEVNEINVLDIVNADVLLLTKQALSDVEEALK